MLRFLRRCDVSGETVETVLLATSEAVTNVVLHAYPAPDASGSIEVVAAVVPDEVWVIVADRGAGMTPRTASPGLGLGLAIIAQVADELELLRRDVGLELRMRFSLRESQGA